MKLVFRHLARVGRDILLPVDPDGLQAGSIILVPEGEGQLEVPRAWVVERPRIASKIEEPLRSL